MLFMKQAVHKDWSYVHVFLGEQGWVDDFMAPCGLSAQQIREEVYKRYGEYLPWEYEGLRSWEE